MNKHLKLRRHTATVVCSNANPQDFDHVECGAADEGSSDYYNDDNKSQDKKDLLSPFSRRLVRFVTPSSHSSLLEQCTASECLTVAAARIFPSLTVLLVLPLLIWDGYPEEWGMFNLYPMIRHMQLVWSSLLHTSMWPIVIGTLLVTAFMPQGGLHKQKPGGVLKTRVNAKQALMSNITSSNWKISLALSIVFSSIVIVNMVLQMGYPLKLWNPLIWGWYRVYLPKNIAPALKGACLDLSDKNIASRQPLCLSEAQWSELSSGMLSSYNRDDVLTVQRGLDYLQNQSGGLIINALARNVVDSIPALKQNMEGLLPFFKEEDQNKKTKPLSLVIFENDSNDGTREAFQRWSDQEASRDEGSRYTVDLMSCGSKNPNCDLGIMDRYDANFFTNKQASGVGKLGEFRQILLDYILGKEEYKDYSHMVVLDVDLGTSLSPLGLLHTLGLENGVGRDHVVASTSSQIWPGAG